MARITRRVLFLLLTVAIVSALVRCSKSDEIDDPNPNTAYLKLVYELPLPFSPKGGKAMLRFSTNESWSIDIETSDDAGNVRASSADRTSGSKTELSGTGATQENSTYAEAASSRTLSTTDDTSASTLSGDAKKWYYVTPLSGDAGDDIAVTVRVDPNEEYTGRSFTLILRSESLERRIEVTQLKKNAIIADDNRREISSYEQTLTVKIKANVSYTVQIKQGDEWIHQMTGSRAGGLTEEQYSFAISANTKDEPRTGIVVFQDVDSDLSDEITIVQAEWDDPDPERSALTAIYKAAAGDSWTHNDNWCSQKPLNQWYGVETDNEGHVTALRLPKNNLAGTISSKISKLTKLKHLDLSWNALEGELTYKDQTTYQIVSDLDKLTEAETIDLSHNRLTGKFMPIDGHKSLQLKTLNLSFNQIRGNMFPLDWYCMFENGRTVDLILNNNYLYGDAPDAFQNHPDWGRLALQFIRQYLDHGGIDYTKDIIFPDFTFTDLRDGSKRSIRDLYSSNTMTMIFAWDPTQEDSKTFMETTVRRFHTLYSGQGFAVVAITPEGDQYRTAAEKYLQSHDVPYPVVTDYADAQGRRTVLPAEPYPSYFLVDQTGKVSNDTFTGQRCESFSPDEPTRLDLIERPLQHADYYYDIFRTFGQSKYQSTDYSMDKKYELLQRATKGKGINIVLIGEAYTDVDIATGYYKQVMEFAMESFFMLEPTKSYREYFNVYMIYAVSRDAYIGNYFNNGRTALKVWLEKGAQWFDVTYSAQTILPKYYDVIGVTPTTVGVVINFRVGGVTFMRDPVIGPCCAFTGFFVRNRFWTTFLHETVGHGFGFLADEYVNDGGDGRPQGMIPESKKNQLRSDQRNGWYLNVSLTDDPKSVNWAHMIGHSNYPYVGIYKGGGITIQKEYGHPSLKL